MKKYGSIGVVLMALLLAACSNTRFLAEDELLYNGREKLEIRSAQSGKEINPVKFQVNNIADQKVNNALLGRRILPPLGLWAYNYWDAEEKGKFNKWLHKKISAPPILISNVNPDLRAHKIQNDLFDMGYFETRVWATVDTSNRNPKKAKIKYTVDLSPPYHYHQIEAKDISGSIDTVVDMDYFANQIREGDQYNLKKLKAARQGLSMQIQDQGYFYFSPEIIQFYADTSIGDRQINLTLERDVNLPASVLSTYEIGRIQVYIGRSSDTGTVRTDTTRYEDMTIYSTGNYLKTDVIRNAVYFKTGDLYSYTIQQSTITRLNNLGIFRLVKIGFQQEGGDSTSRKLNVRIELDMAENINLNLEGDLVMKSTGYLGPVVGAGISHGNAFKGAETMNLALKGGFEWQWGPKSESQLGALSYNYGLSYGLTYPRIILPGKKERIKSILNQQTSMKLDLNMMNRTAYYSMFSIRTNLEYKWKQGQEIQHTFSPVYINSVNLLATTPSFDSVVDNNIYIRKSFEEQFIFGTKYQFDYDNTLVNRPHNFFFQGGISTSGNLVDLFAGLGKEDSERPFKFLNQVYSQFIKLTSDFRYYINGYNKTLAMRLYAGVGLPYMNSEVLPYVEQFFSGGAYSIRGFTARTLGPGSFHEVDNSYIDQSGDLKLEANLEYRFVISKILNGALFIETGNIWLVNEDEARPGSQFNIHTFSDQLAVGSGLGLRFDFNFFVLRADLGFPIRTPYVTEGGGNWLNGDKILKNALFYVAVGYPF